MPERRPVGAPKLHEAARPHFETLEAEGRHISPVFSPDGLIVVISPPTPIFDTEELTVDALTASDIPVLAGDFSRMIYIPERGVYELPYRTHTLLGEDNSIKEKMIVVHVPSETVNHLLTSRIAHDDDPHLLEIFPTPLRISAEAYMVHAAEAGVEV